VLCGIKKKMSASAIRDMVAGVAAPCPVVVPEDYLGLIRQLPLWPIASADVHRRALALANALIEKKAKNGKLSRGESGYLSVLIELLENYEKTKYPRTRFNDGEMLAYLIESKAVTQAQVERDTGIAAPTLSAVIAGRRRLTRDQIGKLASYFRVEPTVFAFEA
jgi:HTH-type transcriptional regulator / antitoxin HigA